MLDMQITDHGSDPANVGMGIMPFTAMLDPIPPGPFAWNGSHERRRLVLEETIAHYKADNYIHGEYWRGSNFFQGRGCAVGCLVRSLEGPHFALAFRIGVPEWLPRTMDNIFEGSPHDTANETPFLILDAIAPMADMRGAVCRIVERSLSAVARNALDNNDNEEAAKMLGAIGTFSRIREKIDNGDYTGARDAAIEAAREERFSYGAGGIFNQARAALDHIWGSLNAQESDSAQVRESSAFAPNVIASIVYGYTVSDTVNSDTAGLRRFCDDILIPALRETPRARGTAAERARQRVMNAAERSIRAERDNTQRQMASLHEMA